MPDLSLVNWVWGINVSYHFVGMIVATMILNQGFVM